MDEENGQTVWKGTAFSFQEREILLPNGRRTVIGRIHHPGSVAIAPIQEDGSVILVYQYRPSVQSFVWEVPGGTLNPGESPSACARRELREECGLEAGCFELLGEVLVAPWYSDERNHLYVATRLVACKPQLDEDEILTAHVLPFDEALAMIDRGEIQDTTTILVLQKSDAVRKKKEPSRERPFPGGNPNPL
jgi:ADP-ribose pyrophosphatase